MKIDRYPENPLITPGDVPPSRDDFQVLGAFNAGVTRYNGETLMLMRVAEQPVCDDPAICRVPLLETEGDTSQMVIREFRRDDPDINFSDPRVVSFPDHLLLTSISHLRLARSRDGRNFTVDPVPALEPDRPSEAFGLEDPRITQIDDTYYIVYKAVSDNGICQALATTKDFVNYDKHGVILCPENMDSMLFPARIGGNYAILHRPVGSMIGGPMMYVGYGTDPMHFGEHHFLLGKSSGGWDSGRVGGGAVPFLTDRGWLELYHAATPDDHYCLGAMLLDAEEPHRMLAKTPAPIMKPEASYEVQGFKANVVFTCGAIVEGERVSVYYGAADEVMAGADLCLSEILEALEPA
ncbi:MAG: glycoside hydrolase family 130 protein [Armatimonadetes bacterium]|nr:glycoside hydrolase family 130 protein [Armatimonadota bacterium]